MFGGEEGKRKLKAILHFFFVATLKPAQYISVIQSFVDNAPGIYFLDFFALLRSLNVVNESFFYNLSKPETTKLLSQLLKRTPVDDSTEIKVVNMLKELDVEIKPPPDAFDPEPIPTLSEPLIEQATYFRYRLMFGDGESVPLVAKKELDEKRFWAFVWTYNPDVADLMRVH